MNKVILKGRMARDPEMRYTTTGKAIASFTLAVNGYGKDAKAEFIPCVAWEKTAELIGNNCVKGSEILVEGRLQVRSYDKNGEKRYVTEVIVTTFEFCGSKADHTKKDVGGFGGEPVPADDIPFI
jgi:single-strand DNA-binding protein